MWGVRTKVIKGDNGDIGIRTNEFEKQPEHHQHGNLCGNDPEMSTVGVNKNFRERGSRRRKQTDCAP